MKRIIGGKTYNTATATLVAGGGPTTPDSNAGWGLYQNRHGVFFKVITDHDGESQRLEPLNDTEAQTFLENRAPDLVEKYFGPFPEAGAAERRLTIRVPGNLANRMEEAATAKGLSLNSFAMRCFEQGVAADGQSGG